MFEAHFKTGRRLAALVGLLTTVALTALPTAVAVPLMPDGEPIPRPTVTPDPGDSAPVVHGASNGLEWTQVGLAVGVGLIVAVLIAAFAFTVTSRRRLSVADR
jgi:hypothetical protein